MRCFAHVLASSSICPECGAPMRSEAVSDFDASPIQTELAAVNLLRMRGDFKAAESACLGILKRFPNNPAAHTMLGDICAEQGDLARASEWYELALDISPESQEDRQKLDNARRRLAALETADTVQQLGLAEVRPTAVILPIAAILLITALATIAFFAGKTAAKQAQTVLDVPISAEGKRAAVKPIDPKDEVPKAAAEPTQVAGLTPPAPEEDRALMQLIVQHSADGARVMSVGQDPRNKQILLTFSFKEGDEPKKIAAMLAKDSLAQSSESLSVVLRGVQEDHTAFIAEVTRTKLAETETTTWLQQNAATPDAWINFVLVNEWTKPVPATPTAPPSGP